MRPFHDSFEIDFGCYKKHRAYFNDQLQHWQHNLFRPLSSRTLDYFNAGNGDFDSFMRLKAISLLLSGVSGRDAVEFIRESEGYERMHTRLLDRDYAKFKTSGPFRIIMGTRMVKIYNKIIFQANKLMSERGITPIEKRFHREDLEVQRRRLHK